MIFANLITTAGGVFCDLIWGDPPRIPHPVVGIGKLIDFFEHKLNRKGFNAFRLKIYGILTVLLTLTAAYGGVFLILKIVSPYPWLFWPVNCWLMGTTIAWKSLNQAGLIIYKLLCSGDLEAARREAGKIVGRDAENLSRTEVIRAAVESVAENSVDGVIAPLLFGMLGGAPLAMFYRAINTLDSMLGYKNERYQDFGWAAARLDDLANLIPARFCALVMMISTAILGLDWRRAARTAWQDAAKHPSPNGGWPEATVAGALGIRLGGINYYQGIASFRNYLGEAIRELEVEDIKRTTRVLNLTTFLVLILFLYLGIGIIQGGLR